jgi:hypothetical protein
MFEVISRRMEAFERESDSWKGEHIEAMACMDFELFVQGAIAVREGIELLHERVDTVAKGDQVKAGMMRQFLWNLMQRWLTRCEDIDREARGFEAREFEVKGIVEFRRLWRDTAQAVQQSKEPEVPYVPLSEATIRIRKPVALPDEWD